MRLWQNHARWEIKTSVKSYLYASVHYELLHTIRHERVQQAHVEDALANANLGIEPQHTDAGIMAETLEQAIEIAIAAMPERRRTAYLLRRQQEMSYAEIAVVMQITLKTVEHQIALALRDLRRALADWLE